MKKSGWTEKRRQEQKERMFIRMNTPEIKERQIKKLHSKESKEKSK